MLLALSMSPESALKASLRFQRWPRMPAALVNTFFCVLRWFNLPKFECMDAAMNSTVMGVARSLRTAGLCKEALWPRNRRLDVWEC